MGSNQLQVPASQLSVQLEAALKKHDNGLAGGFGFWQLGCQPGPNSYWMAKTERDPDRWFLEIF